MKSAIATVKSFNMDRGYGFLNGETGDVFVHHTQLRQPGFRFLSPGQKVRYIEHEGEKGLFAADVVVVFGDASAEVST